MARTAMLIGALFAVSLAIVGAESPEESLPGVLDLTPETFETVVDGKKGVLVEFYAPWCGHCKSLTPEMKKLGAAVQTDPLLMNRVVVAKVNADAHNSLGSKYGVQGFPTIKYFPRGGQEPVDYQGGRKSKNFINFLKKKVEEDRGLGRVDALDELVKGYMDSGDKAAIAKAVTDKVSSLTGSDKENGELYVSILDKATAKGPEYLSTEKARLEKVLSSGSVASSKAMEMSKKVSILKVLLGEADD